MKKILLAVLLALMMVMLPLSNAFAAVERLDYQYAHDIAQHTVTQVRGSFQVNSWSGSRDFIWAVEGDYYSVAEAVFAYYPAKSSTGWIVGIAVGGSLKAYISANPSLNYQYLMTIPSQGQVYFRVLQAGNIVLEWSGHAQSSSTKEFTLAYASNEVISYGTSGTFSATVTHGFLWVYSVQAGTFLKAYGVTRSPDYQEKSIPSGKISISHSLTNFFWDACTITKS